MPTWQSQLLCVNFCAYILMAFSEGNPQSAYLALTWAIVYINIYWHGNIWRWALFWSDPLRLRTLLEGEQFGICGTEILALFHWGEALAPLTDPRASSIDLQEEYVLGAPVINSARQYFVQLLCLIYTMYSRESWRHFQFHQQSCISQISKCYSNDLSPISCPTLQWSARRSSWLGWQNTWHRHPRLQKG